MKIPIRASLFRCFHQRAVILTHAILGNTQPRNIKVDLGCFIEIIKGPLLSGKEVLFFFVLGWFFSPNRWCERNKAIDETMKAAGGSVGRGKNEELTKNNFC